MCSVPTAQAQETKRVSAGVLAAVRRLETGLRASFWRNLRFPPERAPGLSTLRLQ